MGFGNGVQAWPPSPPGELSPPGHEVFMPVRLPACIALWVFFVFGFSVGTDGLYAKATVASARVPWSGALARVSVPPAA